MAINTKPIELESVSCEICLKEVPVSEATVPEAADYVVHFCGLDCYQQWKALAERTLDAVGGPASVSGSPPTNPLGG